MTTDTNNQKFISKAEVFRRLGLYPVLGNKLVETKLIGPYHLVGRYFMFDEADLPKFAETIKPALEATEKGKGVEYFSELHKRLYPDLHKDFMADSVTAARLAREASNEQPAI